MRNKKKSLPASELYARIRQFLDGESDLIDLAGFRHEIVATALHRYAYQKQERPTELQFRFEDGSLASSFPIGCLAQPLERGRNSDNGLRVGLVSFRHGDAGLDYLVDFYVIRNQEIAAGHSTQADREVVAFNKARRVLQEIEHLGVDRVSVYHTGFVPAVLGFYRAVIDCLCKRNESRDGELWISSMSFRGKENREARLRRVTPESALSNNDNYSEILQWH